jgi:hypothetical protein
VTQVGIRYFEARANGTLASKARERHQDDQYSSLRRRRKTYAMLACVFTFGEATPWFAVHGGNDGNLLGSRYVRDVVDVTY